jgi:ring-1,2-phenylacetyl-CoA epoxidase subunit PaaD
MVNRDQIYSLLASVPDPEIPVLTILDLGIVRDVQVDEDHSRVIIVITPTYSGCPAMNLIAAQIKMVLAGYGFAQIQIETQLSPAWTTEWLSPEAKDKLKHYGIAPPLAMDADSNALFSQDVIPCPRCGSMHTKLIARFGATACKAQYVCQSCLEPFEYFKCH